MRAAAAGAELRPPAARSRTPGSTSPAPSTSPQSGPAILVGNHRSYFDSRRSRSTIARTGRTVRFLGKKEVFDAPVVGQLAAAMGGIRVDRGTGCDEPLQAAAEALGAGEMVAIMPQGTIPRGRGVLRPGAEGPLGRGPPGGDDRGAGDPDRAVGHREGVAAHRRGCPTCSTSSTRRRSRSASAGRCELKLPERRRRHEADHEGVDGPAAAGEPGQATSRRPRSWQRRLPRGYKGDLGSEARASARRRTDCHASVPQGVYLPVGRRGYTPPDERHGTAQRAHRGRRAVDCSALRDMQAVVPARVRSVEHGPRLRTRRGVGRR